MLSFKDMAPGRQQTWCHVVVVAVVAAAVVVAAVEDDMEVQILLSAPAPHLSIVRQGRAHGVAML